MRSFTNFTHHIKKNDTGDACSTNEGKIHSGYCWGNTSERNDLEDPGTDGRIILNLNSRNRFVTWTALILLRIGTGGMLL